MPPSCIRHGRGVHLRCSVRGNDGIHFLEFSYQWQENVQRKKDRIGRASKLSGIRLQRKQRCDMVTTDIPNEIIWIKGDR